MVLSTMPTKVRTEEILAREYPCPLPAGLAQIDPKRSSPRDPALKIVERLALQLECQRSLACDSRDSLLYARFPAAFYTVKSSRPRSFFINCRGLSVFAGGWLVISG